MRPIHLLRLVPGVAIAALYTFAVGAQTSADQGDEATTIEEIVVQARKRGESLQEVPVTVSAFTADDIDAIGVSNMRDYAKLIPNFFLVETQNKSFTFVNIRGITQQRNTDPSVAIVIDGVETTTTISMSQELFDIEQIEVYKGPQGALYGRNAMAGAINIRTKRPSNEFEAMLRGGFGNGNSGKTQATISGPLIKDQLFGRAAISYYNSDGFRQNVFLSKKLNPDCATILPGASCGSKADPAENFSARTRLIWTPISNFEADLRFSVSDDNDAALAFTDVSAILHEVAPGAPQSLGGALGIFTCPGPACGFLAAGPVRGGDRAFFDNPFGQPVPFNVGNVNNTTVPLQNNLAGIDHRRIYNVSGVLTWDTAIGTIKSITSYDKASDRARGEQPPRTSVNAQINSQFRFSEQVSEELRITSPDDQRLRWIFGGFVQHTNAFLSTTVQRDTRGIDTLDTFVERDPLPVGACMGPPGAEFEFIFGPTGRIPNPSFIPGQPLDCVRGFDGDKQGNLAFAIFAQAAFDVTDTLEFSFSGRFDRDTRTQTVGTPQQFLIPLSALTTGQKRDANFDSFQPKVTLRWTPVGGFMTYVDYAKGFRSGGFNRPGVRELANFLSGLPLPPPVKAQIPNGIEDIFPAETTRTVEGGFKFATAGGRLAIDASGFYTSVDNYQTFTFSAPVNASQIIIPIDKVKLSGLEFSAVWRALEFATVNVGFGYTDSEIKRDSSRGVAGPRTPFPTLGNKAPQTPKTTVNIGLNLQQPFTVATVEGSVFLRVDYQRQGKLFFNPENFSLRKPLDLVNLRGGINIEGGWQVVGWVKNATNENYFGDGFNPNGLFFYGQLRQWGGEITKRF